MAHAVFISYTAADKATAEAVCRALEGAGIPCWIVHRDVVPGTSYAEAIIDAICEAQAFVLVFSAAADSSAQVRREVERAVASSIPILPLRIEDVVPSESFEYYLAGQHWLDALTPPLDEPLAQLATAVKSLTGPTAEEAAQSGRPAEASSVGPGALGHEPSWPGDEPASDVSDVPAPPLRVLSSIDGPHADGAARIEVCHGDLSNLPDSESIDYLVVSAFPDNYLATAESLVGALARRGVSVESLALHKEVDLRDTCACWLSRPIEPALPGIRFERILCFEPPLRERPEQLVGDVFRSLVPFLSQARRSCTVAMPVLSTGARGASGPGMVAAIADAARHWVSIGLPLSRLMLVERDEERAGAFANSLSLASAEAPQQQQGEQEAAAYDVFLSYAHEDAAFAEDFLAAIKAANPLCRVFFDREGLDPGCAWQQRIYDSLDAASTVVAMFSPAYVRSDFCKEEYNIALYKRRQGECSLLPVYILSTNLPAYMAALSQHVDCREGDRQRLSEAAKRVAAGI